MTIRFDDAWREALQIARDQTQDGIDLVLLRDITGKISFLMGDQPIAEDHLTDLTVRIRRIAGRFAAEEPVVKLVDTGIPSDFFNPPHAVVIQERGHQRGRLALMDRGIVGEEWRSVAQEPKKRRVTFYSFKGGVGRSTAAFALAHELAERGHCTLVVDLDLESPGIGSLLLTDETYPDYGLCDYLIESLAGNEIDLDLVARSPLVETTTNGEVWVAPASGRFRSGYTYVPKLNRAYVDTPGNRFAQRLEDAIRASENAVSQRSRPPDYVLLDSRAGIQDIAAVAITELSDLSLLFAIDSLQNWNGYRYLFDQWSSPAASAQAIRERLRMVAAMVPAAREEQYLKNFRDHAQECLASSLYDNALPGVDAYNPPVEDSDAPHSPIPILFSSDLIGLNPGATPSWYRSELVRASFSDFVRVVADLLPNEAA